MFAPFTMIVHISSAAVEQEGYAYKNDGRVSRHCRGTVTYSIFRVGHRTCATLKPAYQTLIE